ncbi:aspartyl-tRNA(Asn)/glutamyl-tRNA(Gln) amidotransferase subunit A [Natronocella acetinitrilica]|uniref:Aspartyl-tRNA(Asn)/glutamyl-tRNA(Gln) amidotransferase subunit A n=1 Tax=Natronocella acetinitrilica TaxID=414046 RepID=A0AAE3G0S3_9GAMM|nr:amidase [Natronocella acetinitrilica]MCP1673645.1 aspartyl-tRNA(Asn)/glutamyl-tRNA(Gln) amidotransferase subunit A [Natronocella acetinitrilica]
MGSPMKVLTRASALELAGWVRRGELSATEVVTAHLERIDTLNPRINAFCTVTHESALAAAHDLDQRLAAGEHAGLLAGVPIGLKDLTPTRGIRTTRGSRLFANHVPEADAEIVRRLRQQGAIVVGKTNTPEFGHKGVTDNQLFGPTRNPWRPDLVAGGSSGGSSAAVVAGMVPLAEGSDGAGSIRIPAALCGCVGMKPSFGRVPDVATPFSSHSPFFHNGALSRSVADCCLMLKVMAGFFAGHPFSVPDDGLVWDIVEESEPPLRIAYSPDLGYFPIESEVASRCTDALAHLEKAGCRIEEVSVPLDASVEDSFMTFWRLKSVAQYGHLSSDELALLEPRVRQLIAEGRELGANDLARANRERERVWQVFRSVFDAYDLLLTPTTAVAAFPLDGAPPTLINRQPVNPLIGWFLTYPVNLTGHPAASVPCGMTDGGLPVGLQIIGPRLADRSVLTLAAMVERLLPWPMPSDRLLREETDGRV